MGEVIVELQNIRKEFPGVVALDNMSIQLKKGEVHGLIGENGAGKSTLIKILAGVYTPDKGKIILNSEEVTFTGPSDAKERGISCVYQELNIVRELPIVDNLFMGAYVKKSSGLLNYAYMNKKAEEILASMGQHLSAGELCGSLGMGQQQLVEIGKAVLLESDVIILDEPTSSLGEKETDELFRIIKMLKEKNIAILFVSHKLEEIFEICDIVTVMRDGQHISTTPTMDMTKDLLITQMVGRSLNNLYPRIETTPGDVALEINGLTKAGEYYNVSFKARKGEILGFYGLVGAGRTELMHGIFGSQLPDAGEVKVDNNKIKCKAPKDAIKNNIAFLTEDRKQQGLVLIESIEKNMSLVNIDSLKKGIFVDFDKTRKQAKFCVEELSIRTPSIKKNAGELSGGNQQKVVIGKWINSCAEIYIFDEPTRGIDVGAKIEVYNLINGLIKNNKCVIMVSSELPEILGMCERVIVMREGCIMAEVARNSAHFNQEDIMKAAWGGNINE
ncbi:MAG: sugar ABC transporter ATP-binding protein [Eubacteriales bacterium]|nr:sugar ABC transporter ATP-binding protein [Eubacteriales bacterium]